MFQGIDLQGIYRQYQIPLCIFHQSTKQLMKNCTAISKLQFNRDPENITLFMSGIHGESGLTEASETSPTTLSLLFPHLLALRLGAMDQALHTHNS